MYDVLYIALNPPLIVRFPGNDLADPNAWQPLALEVAFTQNSLPQASGLQQFVCPQWDNVTPFALTRTGSGLYIDPGPPPRLREAPDDDFTARRAGAQIGKTVFAKAQTYFDGTAAR